ncbi:MAG: hypothetical protein HY951_10940 [Bacteroidia bacterium]|nr:hypothetical protein [Bacteroidia bacterium]
MVKKIAISILLICFVIPFAFSQPNDVNPNGYNKFYYSNGKVSSEGNMRNGKPDGFWKTYYADGILKSEGNRFNYELDSIWLFFNDKGDTTLKINYKNGKKNGYLSTYEYGLKNGIKTGGIISKELFLNDIKQGISYYYENNSLYKSVTYKDGKKNGLSKEFDKNGKIVAITEYNNDYIINRERINQVDKVGLKQGVWKTFHPNDKIAIESNFLNDTLSGYYKEFDMVGKLIKLEKYFSGKLLSDSLVSEANPIKWVEDFYDNGKVKFRGGYKDGLPIGIHKEYPRDGTIVIAKEYDENGNFIGDGTVDENDKKQGVWKYYYEGGEVKSQGNFKDNLKTGEWIFYYIDEKIEQRGKYNKDKPTDLWTWYYNNGNKWREEYLIKGVEEGSITEYNKEGIVILKGEYVDGEREGIWNFNNGDNTEEGSYQGGLQNGIWKGWFSNGKLNYQVNFVQGVPDGKYKLYYENGNLREEGIFSMGSKEKNWNKFDYEGNLYLTITYKNDKEIKLNGVKIKLPKGSNEQ